MVTALVRSCDVCHREDTGARHVHDLDGGTHVQIRHLVCCATAGCPSGTCTTDTTTED